MKTPTRISRSLTLALAVGAMALMLAACGSSSSSDTTSSAAPAGSTAASGGKTVAVTLADFSISMPKMAMAPGTYTFDVTDNGPSAHNLTINGPGVSNQATSTFASGTQTLTVTLKDGTYDFYCSVPGHKAAGMDVKVTVGSGGGAAATTTEDNGGGSSSSGGGWS